MDGLAEDYSAPYAGYGATHTEPGYLRDFVLELKKNYSKETIETFLKNMSDWGKLDHYKIDLYDAGEFMKLKTHEISYLKLQSDERKKIGTKMPTLLKGENIDGEEMYQKFHTITSDGFFSDASKSVGDIKKLSDGQDKFALLLQQCIEQAPDNTKEQVKNDIIQNLGRIIGHEDHVKGQRGYDPSDPDIEARRDKYINLWNREGIIDKMGNSTVIEEYETACDSIPQGYKIMAEALLDKIVNKAAYEQEAQKKEKGALATKEETPPLSQEAEVAPKAPQRLTDTEVTAPQEAEVAPKAPQCLTDTEVTALQKQVNLLVDGDDKTDKAAWEAIVTQLNSKGINVSTALQYGEFVSTVASKDLVDVVNKLSTDGINQEELAKIGDAMNTIDSRAHGMGIIAKGGQDVDSLQGFVAYDLPKPAGQQVAKN